MAERGILGGMGDVAHCAHCRRPIAAHFTVCPFCNGEQPRRVAKQEPAKCATCKRPYNPSFTQCPFCANAGPAPGAASRAPTPSHEGYRVARAAIEDGESRLASIVWRSVAGIGASLLLAIAVSRRLHAVGSTHLGLAGVVAVTVGAAAALLGPRLVGLDGAPGQRLACFAGGWLAGVSLGYVVLASAMLASAGGPMRARCTVTGHRHARGAPGSPVATHYGCMLPDGTTFDGSEAYDEMPFPIGRSFTLDARASVVGLLYEPKSVRAPD